MIHIAVQPAQGADHVRALLIDRDERVWIGHDTGLIVLPSRRRTDRTSQISFVTLVNRKSSRNVKLPAIAGDAARYTTQDGVSGGMVRALLQSSDGQVWIATLDGLTQFDGERFRAFTKAQASSSASRWPKTARAISGLGRGRWRAAACPQRIHLLYGGGRACRATIRACSKAPRENFTSSASTSISIASTGAGFTAVRANLSEDVAMWSMRRYRFKTARANGGYPGGAGLVPVPKVDDVEDSDAFGPKRSTRPAMDWRVTM